jgi:hypothetical protein
MQIEYVSAAYERFGRGRESELVIESIAIYLAASSRPILPSPAAGWRRWRGEDFLSPSVFSLNFSLCALRKPGRFLRPAFNPFAPLRYSCEYVAKRVRRKESSRNYPSGADGAAGAEGEGRGKELRADDASPLHAARESLWRTSGIVNRPRVNDRGLKPGDSPAPLPPPPPPPPPPNNGSNEELLIKTSASPRQSHSSGTMREEIAVNGDPFFFLSFFFLFTREMPALSPRRYRGREVLRRRRDCRRDRIFAGDPRSWIPRTTLATARLPIKVAASTRFVIERSKRAARARN